LLYDFVKRGKQEAGSLPVTSRADAQPGSSTSYAEKATAQLISAGRLVAIWENEKAGERRSTTPRSARVTPRSESFGVIGPRSSAQYPQGRSHRL
jgi:hypothetical protein